MPRNLAFRATKPQKIASFAFATGTRWTTRQRARQWSTARSARTM